MNRWMDQETKRGEKEGRREGGRKDLKNSGIRYEKGGRKEGKRKGENKE